MEKEKHIITPRSKVMQVIEAYPQLEEVLISYVPAFSKLKNPVLRNTVARIATLQQAAAIGNVKVEELVNRLRNEVGQGSMEIAEHEKFVTEKPAWFDRSKIIFSLDIRKMLEAGEQPVNQAMSDLNNLGDGDIYEVIAPFIPAPLIDKAASLGIRHWINKESAELFYVYFMK